MNNFGVYILKNLRNGRYYIGSTGDIVKRLNQHNSGRVSSTKHLRPLELMRFISCGDSTESKKFEYRLKKYGRKDILEKVIGDGIFPWDH